MSRKACRRRVWPALPPRGLRPRLSHDQLRDLGLAHIVNLDTLANGQADEDTLWQWVGGCLTWSRVATLLGTGCDEMAEQLALVTSVVERYGRTGRAMFTGPEYQLAKAGVGYMGDLAALVDRTTAIQAAEWSERRCQQMQGDAAPSVGSPGASRQIGRTEAH
jgi:hypothetical protein